MTEVRRTTNGVIAVAATFVYFLLFAQFAFLSRLHAMLPATADVEKAMASMGIAGLATSLLTAWLRQRVSGERLLRVGFLSCAVSALASLAATSAGPLFVVSAAIGASTAILTVAVATDLRDRLPGAHFGLWVGLGTGLAYLICNLPSLFAGPTDRQTLFAAGMCLVGLSTVRGPLATSNPPAAEPARQALRDGDVRGLGFASIVLSFLALVWMDSAAFAVIQETTSLKAVTWGDSGRQLLQGIVHFLAAVAAGWLIDRGRFRSLLLAAYGLFVIGLTALGAHDGLPPWAGPVYAVGISFYSVCLVGYPSYRPNAPGVVSRAWRAGAVFGVGGWLGSALGVGMAQDLHHIPTLFVWATGIVLTASWLLAHGTRFGHLARRHGTVVVVSTFAILVAAVITSGRTTTPVAAPAIDAIARGRHVYIREGCINCHSQYVRPNDDDITRFGPHRPVDRLEAPPLLGNRRQGPDLTNVGARRGATWQRLHLENPRLLWPGSRMPAYRHLFNDGSDHGEDLVAYLDQLGSDQRDAWYQTTQNAHIEAAGGDRTRGGELFQRHCAPCHGAEGRGDGPLAPRLAVATGPRPAMNLRKGAFWSISWGPDTEPIENAVGRVIRYGVLGTEMPGHEHLTTGDLADLVAHVLWLRADSHDAVTDAATSIAKSAPSP